MSLAIDSRYNYHLSTLYGSSFVKSCLSDSFSNRLTELLKDVQLLEYFSENHTLEEILSEIYLHLSKNYRSEYVYKNVIANELLIANHDLNEAKIFTEFNSVQSQLDVLIVNGTTTAYEIKTELDNLDRLSGQMNSYQTMFDRTFILTCEANVVKVQKILSESVGILILNSENGVDVVRDAESNKENLVIENIFFALRQKEYIKIIENYFGYIPQVPNTKIFSECLKLFKELTIQDAHAAFVDTLRARSLQKHQISFIENLCYCLKMLFL